MSNLSLNKYNYIPLKHKLQTVEFYEFRNSAKVTGEPNFVRLNVYLSRDGDFTTIWTGLLEPLFVENALKDVDIPLELDFSQQYNTVIFRGYIESDKEMEIILGALRITEFKPQLLVGNENNKLSCILLD